MVGVGGAAVKQQGSSSSLCKDALVRVHSETQGASNSTQGLWSRRSASSVIDDTSRSLGDRLSFVKGRASASLGHRAQAAGRSRGLLIPPSRPVPERSRGAVPYSLPLKWWASQVSRLRVVAVATFNLQFSMSFFPSADSPIELPVLYQSPMKVPPVSGR